MLKKRFAIFISAVILTVIALSASLITAVSVNSLPETSKKNIYRLAACGDNVALYKNNNIVCIYEEIVLNSLPEFDRELFKTGMELESLEDLEEILQDYEG